MVFNVFILWDNEKGSDCIVALEVHMNVQAIASLLELLPESFYVGYCNVNVLDVGSFFVGVVVLVPSDCLCIMDVYICS